MSFGPKPGQTGPIRDIAVIGSGIAGLSVAWLLSARHKVTVLEKDDWAGGHSHTVDIDGPGGPQPVDTGFIVYNAANYPNLAALFDHLGVVTKPSIMSFAASLRGGAVEYSSADLNRLFGQRSNLVSPRFWRMVRDIVRFYGQAQGMVEAPGLDGLTLGQFLAREGFGCALAEDHVLPMCAAIWSTTAGEIRDLPLKSFLRFFASHGLLDIRQSPQWRTVAGGARQYVERLKAPLSARAFWVGTGAKRIARRANGVVVEDGSGRRHSFSDVVIATHADQALALLGDADPIERRVLGAFRTVANRAVLHQDAALMPRRRRVWSSWNYIAGRASEDRQGAVRDILDEQPAGDQLAPAGSGDAQPPHRAAPADGQRRVRLQPSDCRSRRARRPA